MAPNRAIPPEKSNPFLLARRRPTVDHSLAAGGAQRQWLQACLPDGDKPQCPLSRIKHEGAAIAVVGWLLGVGARTKLPIFSPEVAKDMNVMD